jgi:aspartyl protease family protein
MNSDIARRYKIYARHALGVAALILYSHSCNAAVTKLSVVALFKDKAMVVLDGKQTLLRKGKRSRQGVMLVSADAKGAVLEIDGITKNYPLGRQISTQFKAADTSAPIRIWPSGAGMYTVGGTINGFPVSFLVDTGATLIAMNRNEARRLGINFRIDGQKSSAQTASGVVTAYNVVLNKVKVRSIELTKVAASVVDGDFPTQILLGNSFLNRVDMNRKGRAMELRKRNY